MSKINGCKGMVWNCAKLMPDPTECVTIVIFQVLGCTGSFVYLLFRTVLAEAARSGTGVGLYLIEHDPFEKMKTSRPISFGLAVSMLMIGCDQTTVKDDARLEEVLERVEVLEKHGSYTPALGNIMITLQAYHTKLYYAGMQQNWELASYFTHELEETLENVQEHHPEHHEVDLDRLVTEMAFPALEHMEEAIGKKDADEFERGFERLTNTCNSCHAASGYSIIKIRTPENGDFLNQRF